MRFGRKFDTPKFAVFVDDPKSGVPINGVYHLNPALTINGSTVYPDCRYNGKDATSTGWKPWGYGGSDGNLIVSGNGPTVTASNGSPFLGPLDNSVKFTSGSLYSAVGQHYKAINNLIGNITTEDVVVELIFKTSNGRRNNEASIERLIDKRQSTANGWFIQGTSPMTSITLSFVASSVFASISSPSLTQKTWYHAIFFIDAGSNGICYLNGIPGNVQSFAAIGSISTPTIPLCIGSDVSLPFDGNIAYFAMWKKANWLDTHLQGTIAMERFSRLVGSYPQRFAGTAEPSFTRASIAHTEKIEQDGSRRLYQVGASCPRCAERIDLTGKKVKGYLAERAVQNILLRSQAFGEVSWNFSNCSMSATPVLCPNNEYVTSSALQEDATAATQHSMNQIWSATAGTEYTFSIFAKAGNRNWFTIGQDNAGPGNGMAYFDLATGTSPSAGTTIEPYGNGWFRCSWVWRSLTSAAATFTTYIAESSGDITFDGLNRTAFYLFGAQLEIGNLATTYIPTTTAAASRQADVIGYSGSANVGNVGSDKQITISSDFLAPNYDVTSSVSLMLYCAYNSSNTNDRIETYIDTSDRSIVYMTSAANGGTIKAASSATNDIVNGIKHNIKVIANKSGKISIYNNRLLSASAQYTSVDVPVSLDKIVIGSFSPLSSLYEMNAMISNFKIWNKEKK